MRMPGRQSRAKPRGFGPWVDPDLLPPLPRPKKNRKPKHKKRFHHAFRVLIALGLIPSKSRQCDPLGLRLNRMHVMEGDCEKSSGCLTAEGAPEIAKPVEETDAKTPVETKLLNGDHKEDKEVKNDEEAVKDFTEDLEKQVEEDVEQEEEEEAEIEEMECSDNKEKPENEEVLNAKETEKEDPEEAAVPLPNVEDAKPASPEEKDTKEEVLNPVEQPEEDDKHSISSSHISQSEERQKRSAEGDEVSSGSESESGRKKIKIEAEGENQPNESSFATQNFTVRERVIQEFVSECSQNVEVLDGAIEKLRKEVDTLSEQARAKEMEWNALLRVRKLKEEMLERVLRRRRMNDLDDPNPKHNNIEAPNFSNKTFATPGSQNELMMVPIVSSSPGLTHTRGPPTSRNTSMPSDYSRMQRPILPKPSPYPSLDHSSREGRIGTFIDVKSIIADHRARHPEYVPRRGRRMRGDNNMRLLPPHPSSLISMANMALGSGARVRTVPDAPYNLSQEMPHPSNADAREMENFKEHFKHNNNNVNKGPPYPEVTLHPVTRPSSPPTSSLLHGILTKTTPSPANRPASFSPTLARLLTAPERPSNPGPPPHFRPQQPSRVSIAEILKSSKQKSRNEITITPVPGGPPVKSKEDVVLLDDDDAESSDRLVIDEAAENEDVPQCQGCKQKSSQFVCAGCGNQWYCSRECQVTAWEEHSEVCSG